MFGIGALGDMLGGAAGLAQMLYSAFQASKGTLSEEEVAQLDTLRIKYMGSLHKKLAFSPGDKKGEKDDKDAGVPIEFLYTSDEKGKPRPRAIAPLSSLAVDSYKLGDNALRGEAKAVIGLVCQYQIDRNDRFLGGKGKLWDPTNLFCSWLKNIVVQMTIRDLNSRESLLAINELIDFIRSVRNDKAIFPPGQRSETMQQLLARVGELLEQMKENIKVQLKQVSAREITHNLVNGIKAAYDEGIDLALLLGSREVVASNYITANIATSTLQLAEYTPVARAASPFRDCVYRLATQRMGVQQPADGATTTVPASDRVFQYADGKWDVATSVRGVAGSKAATDQTRFNSDPQLHGLWTPSSSSSSASDQKANAKKEEMNQKFKTLLALYEELRRNAAPIVQAHKLAGEVGNWGLYYQMGPTTRQAAAIISAIVSKIKVIFSELTKYAGAYKTTEEIAKANTTEPYLVNVGRLLQHERGFLERLEAMEGYCTELESQYKLHTNEAAQRLQKLEADCRLYITMTNDSSKHLASIGIGYRHEEVAVPDGAVLFVARNPLTGELTKDQKEYDAAVVKAHAQQRGAPLVAGAAARSSGSASSSAASTTADREDSDSKGSAASRSSGRSGSPTNVSGSSTPRDVEVAIQMLAAEHKDLDGKVEKCRRSLTMAEASLNVIRAAVEKQPGLQQTLVLIDGQITKIKQSLDGVATILESNAQKIKQLQPVAAAAPAPGRASGEGANQRASSTEPASQEDKREPIIAGLRADAAGLERRVNEANELLMKLSFDLLAITVAVSPQPALAKDSSAPAAGAAAAPSATSSGAATSAAVPILGAKRRDIKASGSSSSIAGSPQSGSPMEDVAGLFKSTGSSNPTSPSSSKRVSPNGGGSGNTSQSASPAATVRSTGRAGDVAAAAASVVGRTVTRSPDLTSSSGSGGPGFTSTPASPEVTVVSEAKARGAVAPVAPTLAVGSGQPSATTASPSLTGHKDDDDSFRGTLLPASSATSSAPSSMQAAAPASAGAPAPVAPIPVVASAAPRVQVAQMDNKRLFAEIVNKQVVLPDEKVPSVFTVPAAGVGQSNGLRFGDEVTRQITNAVDTGVKTGLNGFGEKYVTNVWHECFETGPFKGSRKRQLAAYHQAVNDLSPDSAQGLYARYKKLLDCGKELTTTIYKESDKWEKDERLFVASRALRLAIYKQEIQAFAQVVGKFERTEQVSGIAKALRERLEDEKFSFWMTDNKQEFNDAIQALIDQVTQIANAEVQRRQQQQQAAAPVQVQHQQQPPAAGAAIAAGSQSSSAAGSANANSAAGAAATPAVNGAGSSPVIAPTPSSATIAAIPATANSEGPSVLSDTKMAKMLGASDAKVVSTSVDSRTVAAAALAGSAGTGSKAASLFPLASGRESKDMFDIRMAIAALQTRIKGTYVTEMSQQKVDSKSPAKIGCNEFLTAFIAQYSSKLKFNFEKLDQAAASDRLNMYKAIMGCPVPATKKDRSKTKRQILQEDFNLERESGVACVAVLCCIEHALNKLNQQLTSFSPPQLVQEVAAIRGFLNAAILDYNKSLKKAKYIPHNEIGSAAANKGFAELLSSSIGGEGRPKNDARLQVLERRVVRLAQASPAGIASSAATAASAPGAPSTLPPRPAGQPTAATVVPASPALH